MTKTELRRELRRLIKEAVRVVGGSGGRRSCEYCLRDSFPGQPQHYRKGFKSNSKFSDVESTEHCAVDVMKAALEALR